MDINAFINDIAPRVREQSPDIFPLFEVYANEAAFGWHWLENDLSRLNPQDSIIEIGGGAMLLACFLRKRGYNITVLEPVGSGFSHFSTLQQLVLAYADAHDIRPSILPCKAEDLQVTDSFRFAYSINVMEHVDDVHIALRNVYRALTQDGEYHFLCPNYQFPFESHFGIPIIFNKTTTYRLFKNAIEHHPRIDDGKGLWASLNWISVGDVKRYCRSTLAVTPEFNTRIIYTFINRAVSDKTFKMRHNRLVCALLGTMLRFKLINWIHWIPAECMPIMDCRIAKK